MTQNPDEASGPFRCTVQVRWADFDQLGHVNNVKYLEYAQEARVLFTRATVGRMGPSNLSQVVRRTEIDHLRPVLRDSSTVDVEVEVEQLGSTSFTLRHTVYDSSGSVCCVLRVVMVAFDKTEGSPVALPQTVRVALEASTGGRGAQAALDAGPDGTGTR